MTSRARPRQWLSKLLTAVVGGYVVANLGAIAIGVLLPLSPPDAVLTGQQLGFVLYTMAVLWVYAADSTARAWGGLALAAAVALLPIALGGLLVMP